MFEERESASVDALASAMRNLQTCASAIDRRVASFLRYQSPPSTSPVAWVNKNAAALIPNSAGLFSSNEEHDDVATPHLKYLLLPYYAAEARA